MKGAWEPDTTFDADEGWMWPTGELRSGHPVYFNGFAAPGTLLSTSVNPNLATLGSSVHPVPFAPMAMLGVWRDCNEDGFVGLGDNGALEYRAELLLNDTQCPPVTGSPGLGIAHNVDGWVIEYVPIGYDDVRTPRDEDPVNLNDTLARVWADRGLPGARPQLACETLPAPRGTFASTGGLLRYADCFNSFRLTQLWNDVTRNAGVPELGFGDAPPDRPDRSGSPLNAPNPWGNASDDPMVRAFDCSSTTPFALSDPTDPGDGSGALHTLAEVPVPGGEPFYVNGTDEEGRIVALAAPALAPSAPLGGSPAGTVNETQAATDCDRHDPDEMVDLDGHRDGSDGDLPYSFEGSAEPVSSRAPRSRSDHALAFEEGLRNEGIASTLFGPRSRGDAGVGAHTVAGFWVGGASEAFGENPYLSRSELGAEDVTFVTYYAYLSPELVRTMPLLLPHGGVAGFYGAEGCDVATPTFVCDPGLWWLDSAGQDVTPRDARLGADPDSTTTPQPIEATKVGVRVGQPYLLRDIDCIDSSVAAARAGGVHWGRLSQTTCPRPAAP